MRKFAVLCMLVGLLATTGALPVTAAILTVQVNAYANINPDPRNPADDLETAWTNTGLTLSAGLPVTITGSGTANRGSGDTGPDGIAGSSCPDYCAGPRLPVASLIGRIGAGLPFLVGVGPTTVTGVGTLYLAFNDGWYQDNRGSYTATIAWNQPPQVAVTGVADGSTYEIGHVPAAACSVVDAEDGTKSVSPQLGAITGPLSADGLGSRTATCSYTDSDNLSRSASATYTISDTYAPTITDRGPTTNPNGTNGWYTSAVTNTFRATDSFDGQPGAGFSGQNNPYDFTQSSGTNEGATVAIASGSVSDVAGNAAGGITSAVFKIDLYAPTGVAFAGGIAEGQQFSFGNVPATPTCTATDAVSGLDTCVVTGYGTAVGSHTLTATATDKAGNQATLDLHYTVTAWTFAGFFQPVDMGGVVNTVKSGATVPLKFTVAKGGTPLTDPAAVVQPLKAVSISCSGSAPTDDIELVATGGTVLRYDAAGQFVYNWQTPSGKAGTCWSVTISTQDGSSQTALFQLK